MLKALYDYAIRNELVPPEGYIKKTVKAYIDLSSKDETYMEIFPGSDEAVFCPDIGSLANGTKKSHVLVEKKSVVIPEKDTEKSLFFKDTLASLAEGDSRILACVRLLEDPERREKVREALLREKVKDTDRISFRIDGTPVFQLEAVLPWWQTFRKELMPEPTGEAQPCLITGKMTMPIRTVPPVSGLKFVGGHASGDSLICFDKKSFCSYNLEQAANAPVSEDAMRAVNAALENLLQNAPVYGNLKWKHNPERKSRPAPIIGGIKFVHWYDEDIPEDPIVDMGIWDGLADDDEEDDESEDASGEVSEDMARWEQEQKEREAVAQADRLIVSPVTGEVFDLSGIRYHILMLSGAGGRIMVRQYECGQYEELQRNIRQWNQDLELFSSSGKQLVSKCKLTARLLRLTSCHNSKKMMESLSKELSGATPAILSAILHGYCLPDSVAVRALNYIRSGMYDDSSKGSTSTNKLDGWAFQWLKVYLVRKEHMNHQIKEDERILSKYNMHHPEPAYHCGGMMAVYAAIQAAGYANVNVSVVERFYASAIQTPALVLGRLSQMSVHHLEKISNKWVADLYRNQLAELYTAVGDTIPTVLNLEKQSYFALGYYQMTAKLNEEKNQRIADSRQRKQAEADTKADAKAETEE